MKSIFIFLCFYNLMYAQENKENSPYKSLAIQISSEVAKVKNNKIAVLPFSYAESTGSVKDGSIIAERLATELIKTQKVEVIERNVLEKVMSELKLQNSGIVDTESAKKLGKVLGVDIIVSGTLVKLPDNKIEVNSRLIETQSAKAIKAFQIYVVKDWIGGDVENKENVKQKIIEMFRKRGLAVPENFR